MAQGSLGGNEPLPGQREEGQAPSSPGQPRGHSGCTAPVCGPLGPLAPHLLCGGQPSGWSILLLSVVLAHLALSKRPVDSVVLAQVCQAVDRAPAWSLGRASATVKENQELEEGWGPGFKSPLPAAGGGQSHLRSSVTVPELFLWQGLHPGGQGHRLGGLGIRLPCPQPQRPALPQPRAGRSRRPSRRRSWLRRRRRSWRGGCRMSAGS